MKNLFLITICFIFSYSVYSQTSSSKRNFALISKSELLEAGELNASLENFDFDYEFSVVSYSVTSTINGYCYEVRVVGNKFTKDVIHLISLLKRGQRIYFEDIKVKGSDGQIRSIQPLVLKIK